MADVERADVARLEVRVLSLEKTNTQLQEDLHEFMRDQRKFNEELRGDIHRIELCVVSHADRPPSSPPHLSDRGGWAMADTASFYARKAIPLLAVAFLLSLLGIITLKVDYDSLNNFLNAYSQAKPLGLAP